MYNAVLIEPGADEARIRHVHTNLHVAKVFHLLALISHTVFMDRVISRTDLGVQVITGQKNELPSLVIIVVLDAPDCCAIFKGTPFDAEQISFALVPHELRSGLW